MKNIMIAHSRVSEMKIQTDKEAREQNGKGWSAFNVYSLQEMRDIFLVIKLNNCTDNNTVYCKTIGKIPYNKTAWNERRVLEHINALKSLNIIDNDFKILIDLSSSEIGAGLNDNELTIFKQSFNSYFRFKEFMSLFHDQKAGESLTAATLADQSHPLFYYYGKYDDNRRFVKLFSDLIDDPDITKIPDDKDYQHYVRFWDVFLSWGIDLRFIEKFSLSEFDLSIFDNVLHTNKEINCVYFINNQSIDIDLIDFIRKNMTRKKVFIPLLIARIVFQYRFPLEKIREYIVNYVSNHFGEVVFERTSEIFIRDKNRRLYPKEGNSYVSHIILTGGH